MFNNISTFFPNRSFYQKNLKKRSRTKNVEEKSLPKSLSRDIFLFKKVWKMNQKVFEETFSTKKVKGIISRKTFENLWREIFNILWRQIPTKQISEEISTKESLKNNFSKKTEDKSLQKKTWWTISPKDRRCISTKKTE